MVPDVVDGKLPVQPAPNVTDVLPQGEGTVVDPVGVVHVPLMHETIEPAAVFAW